MDTRTQFDLEMARDRERRLWISSRAIYEDEKQRGKSYAEIEAMPAFQRAVAAWHRAAQHRRALEREE